VLAVECERTRTGRSLNRELVDVGAGGVRAVTYEYGNAFLIVAGLLNLLVVIDAFDVARGRK